MIENVIEISQDGRLLEYGWAEKDITEGDFSVIPIVGIQWELNGETIIKKFSCVTTFQVLADKTGVIGCETSVRGRKREVVCYDACGKERFRIAPPRVSQCLKESEAHFYYLRYVERSNAWECFFYDGVQDYRANLNVNTGELSDFVETRV